ncbi:hypothetical protein QLL95_gp1144 [Cotonvirus japonicus]|uniref:Uncharacterized protein n=1 Tax=Cotonvirus japonicus TaxID=2811091 RepID=A0ABM7NS48_9VIRU|nr:hypothetical protein QLL95_gp1144 [Cotonvirus japonicus]BCS82979.1 hypothetical protein [Cotonvirus japonicus]
MENEFDVKFFVEKFRVIKCEEYNCEYLSFFLHGVIINNSNVSITKEESDIFTIYQDNVLNLIDEMRELQETNILEIFNYLDSIKYNYLIDVIIMWWCHPINSFISKFAYNKAYINNVQKYNSKLINNITFSLIKHFCLDALSRSNKIPIHCIDLLWYYMNDMCLEFEFYNSNNCLNIGLTITESESIIIGFNMEYLLESGLGKINYPTDIGKKKSFATYLKDFVVCEEIIENIMTSKTKNNYVRQIIKISDNPKKYFGDILPVFPQEIINKIKSYQ